MATTMPIQAPALLEAYNNILQTLGRLGSGLTVLSQRPADTRLGAVETADALMFALEGLAALWAGQKNQALTEVSHKRGQFGDFATQALQPYAAKLREMTLRNAARAHGRLLAVLADHGLLDETISPAQRLTRPVADVFVEALMRAGNCNNTIKVRIFDLRAALKIIEPKVDTAWLSQAGDWSLHVLLPTERRRRRMVGMVNIYEMGPSL